MLAFLIDLYCPEICYRPDHSLNITGKIIILNPRTFVFTVSSTAISFKDIR
jgi:hypothetical protein